MICKRSINIGFFLLLTFVLFTNNSSAQEAKGSISGTITDVVGAVVPEATVTLTVKSSENISELKRTVVSNENGLFNFANVPAAIYEITIESGLIGMSYKNETVRVNSGQTTKLDAQLSYGGDCAASDINTLEITNTDLAEIINRILEDSLLINKIPDYEMLSKQKGEIVLSTRNIQSDWVKPLKDVNLRLMSESQIQQRADTKGDFLYLSFAKFETKGKCLIVTFTNSWAVGKNSGMGYLSGGGLVYLYRKESDKLVGKSIGGWIS